MSAQVIPFRPRRFVGVDLASEPSYTVRHRPATPEVPVALIQQPDAVAMVVASGEDDVEIWFSGEQAIALGEDLIRLGRLAIADQAEREGSTP